MSRAAAASPSIYLALPPFSEGMRIGLLGGSFNPPHLAHLAISLFAIKRLQLDRVWWLVTPGNPLKQPAALRDLDQRAHAARRIARDPRIEISCLEAVIGTRYTVDTISYLRRGRPSAAKFSCARRAGRPGAGALPNPGK
jgi:nicotinate-nucleotide adenylyltransferase